MKRADHSKNKTRLSGWLKRFGFVGFMFFFIKGLLWLIVPALLIWLGVSW